MKKFLFVFLAVIVGLAVGVYRIAKLENSKSFFRNGNWTGSKSLPLGKDDLITAQVSVFALFALPSEEAIYLFARRDEKNELLHSENDYSISGNVHQLKAKYWSITAYGKDLYLIPNAEDRYAFNNTSLQTDSAGNFSIIISPVKKTGNWLPSPFEKKRFNLVLRIYKGDKAFIEQLDTISLPQIKQIPK